MHQGTLTTGAAMTDEGLVARANAYSVLARALALPASWDEALLDGLRERFALLGDEIAELAQRVAHEMDLVWADREAVAVAFAQLFVGPFELDAPPYASLYLDPEQRLMGPVSLAVADLYADAGLAPSTEVPRDAPDHVGHELEFMYFLVFEAVESGEPIWMERAARFWNTHLGDWLPQFAEAVITARRHPLYDALGQLLLRFARDESRAFAAEEA